MMQKLTKIVHTKYGGIAISIILGLGLASLFRRACNERNCIIFKAPSMNEITDNVYEHNNKCYKFSQKSVSCDPAKKVITT